MLECYVCHNDVACTLKELFVHLKQKHGIFGNYGKYMCSQGQCCRTFSNKFTFSAHLRKFHAADIEPNTSSEHRSQQQPDTTHAQCTIMELDEDMHANCDADESACTDVNNIDIMQLAAMFISEAKSCISTLSTVQRVVKACQNMFETVVDDLCNDLERTNSLTPSVKKKLDLYRNPFRELETEYSQTAYLENLGTFIRPETDVKGSRQRFLLDKTSDVMNPDIESVTGQYVSIRTTIRTLNAKTNLIEQTLCKNRLVVQGCYQSYFDGNAWQQHPLKESDVLVLRLYGNDFEPANPLGSRKTVYKVGCIYFQFENLPSHLLSRTENMFLALCYHTDEVKCFGWDKVLRPLINELLLLESDGIRLNIQGSVREVKVVLAMVTADNLFLNGILGFVESFTASKPCRHCSVDGLDFQVTFTEDRFKLRTVESYDAAVETVDVHATGIKQPCALNRLAYFHAARNYIQDIMHDIYEGVLAYDILLICSSLVTRGYFSLSWLNHRLQNFNYGYYDSKNKPPIITSFDTKMLPFDASQSWCIARVLSLAVGDMVSEDDDVWLFYLLLRQILDIIVASTIVAEQLNQLRTLISEYLEMRKLLFPEETLKNKHHHMIHYPSLIEQVGPLQRFSCMRFESKHQRSKKLLHISGNYKNVPKSCAYRHQHDLAYRLVNNNNEATKDIAIGTGSVLTLSELDHGCEIDASLGGVGMWIEFYDANWIEIRGTQYKPNCIIIFGLEEDGNCPRFLHVDHILVRDSGSKIWFVGEKLQAVTFLPHYHAWTVSSQDPKMIVSVPHTSLTYFSALKMTSICTDKKELQLISVRYHI